MSNYVLTRLLLTGFAVVGVGLFACSSDDTDQVVKPENRPAKDKLTCSCQDCWICGDVSRAPNDVNCPVTAHMAVGSAAGTKSAEPCRTGGCATTAVEQEAACKQECVDDSVADCTGPFVVQMCEGLACKGGVAGGYGSNTKVTDSTIRTTQGSITTSFQDRSGSSGISLGDVSVTGCDVPPCEMAFHRIAIESPGFTATTTVTIPIPIPPFTTDITFTNTLSAIRSTNDGTIRAVLGANGTYQMNAADALLNVSFMIDGKSGATTVQPEGVPSGAYNPITGAFTLNGRWRGEPGSHYDGLRVDVNLVGNFVNRAPNANAGLDLTMQCTSNHSAPVVLDASGTFDLDSDPMRFLWTLDNVNRSRDVVTTVAFPEGVRAVTLTVFDAKGAIASDQATIRVVDTTPPRFTFIPAAVVVADCTVRPVLGQATAIDDCGNGAVVTNNAPSTFPLGNTIVTWTARDSQGNAATAIQMVTVPLGDNPACCPAGTNVVVLTSNNDTFNGTAGNDCILGRGGQDLLSGGAGNDIISGGDGDDVINGGAGNDRVFGGSGQDLVNGGDGDDQLGGGDGDDRINGEAGNDILSGGQGQDRMTGGVGNDILVGNDGDDTLDGGDGNDILDGSGLHDLCIGGAGTNTFLTCERRQ